MVAPFQGTGSGEARRLWPFPFQPHPQGSKKATAVPIFSLPQKQDVSLQSLSSHSPRLIFQDSGPFASQDIPGSSVLSLFSARQNFPVLRPHREEHAWGLRH